MTNCGRAIARGWESPTDRWHRVLTISTASSSARPLWIWPELFGRELDHEHVRYAVDRQYEATIEAAELRSDCLDSLRDLRERGLHVQIVSNIDEEQLEELVRRLGLEPAIDAWTSSESAQSCKPDPGIYEYALEKARCTAAQVLFVGDSPAHDVTGPQALGILTALLVADARSSFEDCSPDFVIERLGQVVEIVERELIG